MNRSSFKSICKGTQILAMLLMWCFYANAQNPYLPPSAFIPDGEPHVFTYKGETRVYLYGSRDEMAKSFCGTGHDVWSAPVNDLTHWTNHGEVINVKQITDLGFGKVDGQVFFAPDCAYNPVTKKYYLYVFLGVPYKLDGKAGPTVADSPAKPGFEDYGPTTFVAESDSPTGPFVNPQPCEWPTMSQSGAFDPAVFVDEQADGSVRVYAYFGNIQPNCWWAELDPTDMHTIINAKTRMPNMHETYRILNNPTANNGSKQFEASSLRKVAPGKYIYICSALEHISALTYFYSNSPEGPWNYGGQIVDNSVTWNGGNDHGSIANCDGKWYVFYHRRTTNDYNRQGAIEPIELRIEGDKVIIPHVEMTSQGIRTEGLNPFQRYWAGTICALTQNTTYVDGLEREPDGLNPVIVGGKDPFIGWKYFNFGNGTTKDLKLKVNVKADKAVSGEVKAADPNDPDNASTWTTIGKFSFKAGNSYADQIVTLTGKVEGRKAIYLTFNGEGKELCRIKEIEFAQGNAAAPNPLRTIAFKPSQNGTVKAIPTRARVGESVRIEVTPNKGYRPSKVEAADAKGNKVQVDANCITQYGPLSYNVFMPASGLTVTTTFEKGEVARPVEKPQQLDASYFDGRWKIISDNDLFRFDMEVTMRHDSNGKLDVKMISCSIPGVTLENPSEKVGRSVSFVANGGSYPMAVNIERFKPDLAAGTVLSMFSCHAVRMK